MNTRWRISVPMPMSESRDFSWSTACFWHSDSIGRLITDLAFHECRPTHRSLLRVDSSYRQLLGVTDRFSPRSGYSQDAKFNAVYSRSRPRANFPSLSPLHAIVPGTSWVGTSDTSAHAITTPSGQSESDWSTRQQTGPESRKTTLHIP